MISAGDTILQSEGTPLTVPVVESIKRDAAGHVTEIKVRNYRLEDTNGHLTTQEFSTQLQTNKVIISSSVSMETSTGGQAGIATGAFAIESESITIGANGATVSLELVWGEF